MVHIRQEITQVEQGQWPQDNNPLINAPHTAEDLTQMDWPYLMIATQQYFRCLSLKKTNSGLR